MNHQLLAQTESDMQKCIQFADVSVMDHGELVMCWARRLARVFTDGTRIGLCLPAWFNQYGQRLIERIDNWYEFEDYLLYHDCGKPYCRIVDENGKQHFPDHQLVSYRKWLEIDGPGYVAQCILYDMDFHTLKPEGIATFAARPEAPSLMIAGLAEIHANAEMFGGIDSTGFKIKFAQIERRGKKVCQILFGDT